MFRWLSLSTYFNCRIYFEVWKKFSRVEIQDHSNLRFERLLLMSFSSGFFSAPQTFHLLLNFKPWKFLLPQQDCWAQISHIRDYLQRMLARINRLSEKFGPAARFSKAAWKQLILLCSILCCNEEFTTCVGQLRQGKKTLQLLNINAWSLSIHSKFHL